MDGANTIFIKRKIINGVVALTSRTLFLQLVTVLSTVILTILLSPSIFGVFFIVSAFISFLTYFADIGLAAALIQKKEEPTQDELKTTFTIQQMLVFTIVVFSFIITPYLKIKFKLGNDGIFLFQAFIISFFLSSLKTIPSIILERKLEFNLLVVPQILESLVFYITAIVLAKLGYGIYSFAWAVIMRGVVGTITIYLLYPWRISFGISFSSAKKLLKFGVPFQANSVLALIKDDLMTIFLGTILPFTAIGYIGWAKKYAEMPLRLIMDSIIRVTFPTYSRLQEDNRILKKAIEKSLFFLALFIFPITIILVFSMQPLIQIIPKYQKWQPAIISFYLFAFSSVFAAFSSPILNALNAIGKVKITLKLMVVWTALTWILIPVFVSWYGYNGVAMVAFIISFTGVLPIIIMRKFIEFQFIKVIIKPLVSAVILGVLGLFFINLRGNLSVLILTVMVLSLTYLACVIIWMKEEIAPFIPKFNIFGKYYR